jgi:hypothetical protein
MNKSLISCPNFKVCGNRDTEIGMNCNDGRCLNCDIQLGKWRGGRGDLNFKTIEKCPVCFEENIEGVSLPRCEHFMCEMLQEMFQA